MPDIDSVDLVVKDWTAKVAVRRGNGREVVIKQDIEGRDPFITANARLDASLDTDGGERTGRHNDADVLRSMADKLREIARGRRGLEIIAEDLDTCANEVDPEVPA